VAANGRSLARKPRSTRPAQLATPECLRVSSQPFAAGGFMFSASVELRRRVLVPLSAAIKAGGAALLALHFAATFLYCFPSNPLKLRVNPYLISTIGAFFPQNWSLFAPNPLSANQSLLVHCLTPTEHGEALAGRFPSHWTDLSASFWRRFQSNRFAAYDRISRAQSEAISRYLNGGPSLEVLAQSCSKGDQSSCEKAASLLEAARKRAASKLTLIGSAYCVEIDPKRHMTHVALRLRIVNPRVWSERGLPPNAPQDYALGVYPIDRDVARTGLFEQEATP
jgi:Family of unknown function (DUF5819)